MINRITSSLLKMRSQNSPGDVLTVRAIVAASDPILFSRLLLNSFEYELSVELTRLIVSFHSFWT